MTRASIWMKQLQEKEQGSDFGLWFCAPSRLFLFRGVEMCGVALGRQLLPLEACGPSSHHSPCQPLCDPRRLQRSSGQRGLEGSCGCSSTSTSLCFLPSETGIRIAAASSGGRGLPQLRKP